MVLASPIAILLPQAVLMVKIKPRWPVGRLQPALKSVDDER